MDNEHTAKAVAATRAAAEAEFDRGWSSGYDNGVQVGKKAGRPLIRVDGLYLRSVAVTALATAAACDLILAGTWLRRQLDA